MLNEEQLANIEDLAGNAFSVSEIAIVLDFQELECKKWMEDRLHPFFRAYNRGKLKLELDLRKEAIKLAKQGSSPAFDAVQKLMMKQRIDDE